jgi:hypothetical protein
MSEGLVRLQFEARLYFLELHSLHTVGAPSGNVLQLINDCIFISLYRRSLSMQYDYFGARTAWC